MARTTITEAVTSPVAPSEASGRLQIGLITPGWGSSGYYSQKVLENAANDRVWPAGTQMYLDHPSESEMFDRPERSVRDLAAVLTEDARWDGSGLVAEAQVIGPYRELLTDETFVESVGVSIRSFAETTTGEAEGRKGTIITRLTEGQSVDFVTKAGRGGRVLAVIESARVEATEALTRETRELLGLAVGAGGWVVDFDPDEQQVIYRREWEEAGTYHSDLVRDGYTVTNGVAALANNPEQVRQTVDYVPLTGTNPAAESGPTDVPAPAGQQETHPQESEEDTMPQIEEARLRQLEEAHGRVPTLESERDTAQRELEELREANARRDRHDRARAIIAERLADSDTDVTFTPLEERGLTAELPVTDGKLDEDAFTKAVDKAIASKAREAGAGTITGFGTSTPTQTEGATEADVSNAVAAAFGRQIKEA